MGLRKHISKHLLFGIAASFTLAANAIAAPDWELVELRRQLTQLSDEVREDGPARARSVWELAQEIDWPLPVKPGSEIPRADLSEFTANLGWTDFRTALAPMRQIYGAENDKQIHLALGENTEALKIESGVATLDGLRQRLTHRHLTRDRETGADMLRVPLIIGPDATLRLGQEDRLTLNRTKGSFIINFGRLELYGAAITTTEKPNPNTDSFTPFITTVGGGSVHAVGAKITGLGFGHTAKFSGFSVMAYPTMRPAKRTVIQDSQFESLVTLSMVGVTAPELRGNRFYSMRRNSLLVSRSAHVLLVGNLFAGNSPTNAIRVTNGSSGAKLIGNIILEGSRTGFLVASGSDAVVVRDNLIWRRNGGGVKLLATNCAVVSGNLILDDKQKGIEVRSSKNAVVAANEIIGNRNAGVWVSAQEDNEITYVTNNLLRENGSGLSTAGGGALALSHNDMTNQFPRFLDGDLTHQFREVVNDLSGQIPILLSSLDVKPAKNLVPRNCSL